VAEVTLQENLWQRLVTIAIQQRRKPEALAESILREYLQRVADEKLLAETGRVARRTKFRMVDTEAIIRQHRHEKARKPSNGGA
jgi:hypothetical protein